MRTIPVLLSAIDLYHNIEMVSTPLIRTLTHKVAQLVKTDQGKSACAVVIKYALLKHACQLYGHEATFYLTDSYFSDYAHKAGRCEHEDRWYVDAIFHSRQPQKFKL